MNVKQAVATAKDHIEDWFRDEKISNLGLEEVEWDDDGIWRITIGFSRPWDRSADSVLRGMNTRTYKVMHISDETGRVLSMKDRQFSKAS